MTKRSPSKPKELTTLPIDREVAKSLRAILSNSLVGAKTVDDGTRIEYTAERGGKMMSWHFDKAIAGKIKEEFKKKDFVNFNLGLRALNTIYAMIYFAAIDQTGLEGEFTINRLMKLWGGDSKKKRGGRYYDQIQNTIMSLGSLTFYSVSKTDKGDNEIIFRPLFSELIIKGEGAKQVISYEFNRKALGANSNWLEGEKFDDRSVFLGGYLPVPTVELKETNIDPNYHAFRERIRLIQPSNELRSYLAATILKKWLMVSANTLKRRQDCRELIMKMCKIAVEQGIINAFHYHPAIEKTEWLENDKVTLLIRPPV